VIHGFYVPAFRLKMDAVPGRVNTTWFEPIQLGAYDIECTVICGVSHSLMLSKVVIVPEEEFKAWYFGDENAPEPGGKFLTEQAKPAAGGGGSADPPGLVVLKAKNCLSCHSIDGKPMVGPTLKGLYGSEETVIVGSEERKAKVDQDFLEKAIQDPMAERAKGYPPTMPPNPLTVKELADVTEYIRSLK
jgi:cytochrome c oxidase subunit 2